jgi:hypothetical protein
MRTSPVGVKKPELLIINSKRLRQASQALARTYLKIAERCRSAIGVE